MAHLKKEIAYHGDPINTAYRICKFAGNKNYICLISSELKDLFKSTDNAKIESIGAQE